MRDRGQKYDNSDGSVRVADDIVGAVTGADDVEQCASQSHMHTQTPLNTNTGREWGGICRAGGSADENREDRRLVLLMMLFFFLLPLSCDET